MYEHLLGEFALTRYDRDVDIDDLPKQPDKPGVLLVGSFENTETVEEMLAFVEHLMHSQAQAYEMTICPEALYGSRTRLHGPIADACVCRQ